MSDKTIKSYEVSGFDTVNHIDDDSTFEEVHVQGISKVYSCPNDVDPELQHTHQKYSKVIYHVKNLMFAGRYLKNKPLGEDKALNKWEVFYLCNKGLGIVSIWQWSGSDPDELNNQGKLHATNAIERATTFGQHAGTPIFFAFENKDSGNEELAKTYFSDVNSILSDLSKNPREYKLGIYACGEICRIIREEHPGVYTFCAGAPGLAGGENTNEEFTAWDIKQSCAPFFTSDKKSMAVDWIISPETGRRRECSWRHKFGDTWRSDHPNYHYVECTECGYRHTEAHQYGNYEVCDEGKKHSRTCAVCGHLDISYHVYEEGWTSIDARRHKRTCSVCGYVDVRPHDYIVTKTEEGHRLECRICGHVIEGAHTFGNWERTDDSNHARKCKVCGYSESVGHNFETWEYNDADTHKRLCPICNWTQVKSHDYSEWQPTRGSHHTHSCSECGHTETENHNFGPWQSSGASTHERRCIDCDYCESAGHNFNDWVYDSATPEKHKRTCAVCKKVERQYHSYGGCTNQGSEGHMHTCSVCHHE